jgi:hypothetical protein
VIGSLERRSLVAPLAEMAERRRQGQAVDPVLRRRVDDGLDAIGSTAPS